MTRHALRRTAAQAGFTLAEILVATAVFLIIFLGAMLLYDRSNQVFKQGVEASNMQQNTRVAFDKLVADIRMAGFDFDRDGRPSGGIAVAWRAKTLYGRGAIVSPTDPALGGSVTFRCDVAGTSAATEPDWSTAKVAGDTVTESTGVKWIRRSGTAEYQQPDEQLEYVGSSAITVRANFNYEDPLTEDNGREFDYEPKLGQFPIVTTSNKEIATYALRSDRGINADDITFYADITKPRSCYPGGSKEELVTVGKFDDCMTGGVWDGCKQPPYTLYRVTLADDYATSGKTIETPIASNIRSIHYTYYEDIAGTEALKDLAATPAVIPNGGAIGGNGQYDPADSTLIIADRLIRQKIKSIGVELVGMDEAPDMNYTNPDETLAAYTDTAGQIVDVPRYRQYHVETLVSPRNIGKHGMREQDVLPPGPPKMKSLEVGACGIVTVNWDPPDPGPGYGAVEQYQVEWKQCSTPPICDTSDPFPGNYLAGLDTTAQVEPGGTPDTTWVFRVKAFNGYGSAISSSTLYSATLNRTKPEPPAGLAASTGASNEIDLSWTRPLKSVSGDYRLVPTGGTEPAPSIPADEVYAYEVYRSTTTPVARDAAHLVFNGPRAADPISGAVTWQDKTVTNCQTYYYTIRAVERCFAKDSYNEGPAPDHTYAASDFTAPDVSGSSTSTATPAAPSDLTLASTLISGFSYDILLQWPLVSTDTTGAPLNVSYEIQKLQFNEDGSPGADTFPPIPVPLATTPIVQYHDTASLHDASGKNNVYYLYRVHAVNCGLTSAWTVQRRWPCDFDPTITIGYNPEPASFDGDGMTAPGAWLVSGTTGIRATVSAAGVTIHAVLYRAADGAFVADLGTHTTTSTPDSWVFGIAGAEDGVIYRVDVTAMDSKGCIRYDSRYIQESPAGCCLAPNGFATVVSRGVSTVTVSFINMCDETLTFDPNGIVITFASTVVKGSATKLSNVTYPKTGGGTVDDPSIKGSGASAGTVSLLSSTAITAGASRTIAPGGTYNVLLTFSTDSFSFNCATGIYRKPTDLSAQTCRIYPGTGGTTCP